MLKIKRAARAKQAALESSSSAPASPGTSSLLCLSLASALVSRWRVLLGFSLVVALVLWFVGNSGGDASASTPAAVAPGTVSHAFQQQAANGAPAAAPAPAAAAVAAASAAAAAPVAAAPAPDSGMCTRWPFTAVDAPADAGRAGCAYGDKKQFVDAYTSTPGSEFSNSDDVVWAFLNDVAQWSRSGAQGWDKHMREHGSTMVLVDVGANVGGFSKALQSTYGMPDNHQYAQLHAFEPYPVTFKTLTTEMGLPRPAAPIFLHNVALTDAPTVKKHGGSAEFFGAYLSINPNPTGASIGRTEEVQVSVGMVNLTTADAFFEELEAKSGWGGLKGKDWILPLFKIDTEGQDLAVLRGMEGILTRKRPVAMTFEWGAKWQLADPSYTLVEALNILNRHGYETFHSGNHRQGVFHWIPLSCQYWDEAYLRTLEKKHNHYQGTNIFAIRHDAPFLERFRKVHVFWEKTECNPPDWKNRAMP